MTKPLPFGNLSVMSRRQSPPDGLDDFPTPPWATRALFEMVFPRIGLEPHIASAHEPAYNRGIMAEVIKEYADAVTAGDVFPYGYSPIVENYLTADGRDADWVITNAPFNKGLEFAVKALDEACEGVALLFRTQWAEGVDRYDQIFSRRPPTAIGQFVERVPMVEGRWDPDADTMTAYAWFVWRLDVADDHQGTEFVWIPPGQRRLLTRQDDAARFCEPAPAPLLEGLAP